MSRGGAVIARRLGEVAGLQGRGPRSGRRLRSLCIVGAALSLGLASACGGGDGGSTAPPPAPRDYSALFRGADVSALERIEQAGGVFRDGGVAGDAIAILRAKGINGFRLRIFVDPNGQEVQVNDLAYTLRMAARVKAAGAKLLLDFHYSDTWADPSHQTTPAAWSALGLDSLESRVEAYTAGVIGQMKTAGTLPDIVQVGNEIDAGFLWPLGQLSYGADSAASWDRFTRLLKAAIRGVRGALGPTDTVRILLHYSQGASAGGTQWFFDKIGQYGVPYDLIGLSYYPWWHGMSSGLWSNLSASAQRYGKPVLVVETTYPWRAGGWEGGATTPGAMVWPVTPAGQKAFLFDILDAVAAVPSGRGGGVVWWYPEAIQVSGLFVWGGGSLALFDATGNVLPAASAFTGQ